jgi:PAS domain S-box-containing protein
MQKSIFFRRILILLVLALLLWTVLTALLYSVISRPVFTRIKVAELQPKAETIAAMAAQSFMQIDPYFTEVLNQAQTFFDAWIFIVDGLSEELRHTALPADLAAIVPEIETQIDQNLESIMSGEFTSLWFTYRPRSAQNEMLFIGVPVTIRFGRQNTVVGAVFFVKPLHELIAGLRSMNIALLASSLFVFALMLIPAYWATARLIRPLRQTRDVALAMASGNFQVRADTRQKGEIGELAATINNLARDLSQTIADLVLERNRLKQVLDGMSDGLIAVGLDGAITQANQAIWALLGQEIGLSVQPVTADPVASPDLTEIPELADALKQAIDDNTPTIFPLQAGERCLQVQVAPLPGDNGDVAGAVALVHDITESERLEQTRRDYVANVSHELRSPLTAMRALIEPLSDGMVAEESDRRRYYDILLRETIRLSRLIDDMLELSRLQAGNLSLNQERFSLSDMLQDLCTKYGRRAEESGLTLILPDQLDRCPDVFADPDRTEQVLVILLDNAMKFTPDGGQVRIILDWNAHQVLVSVEDTGIGIDPADIQHVFDRFFKADKAHQQPGTGLGLSIAREILQRMGQSISVRSQSGRGTCFTFSLSRPASDQTRRL